MLEALEQYWGDTLPTEVKLSIAEHVPRQPEEFPKYCGDHVSTIVGQSPARSRAQ